MRIYIPDAKFTEIMKLLIGAGTDVNHSDRYGSTTLWEVACIGNCELMQMLLDAGADVNAACEKNYTALMYAACNVQKDVNSARILLKAGAVVNACDYYEITALNNAALGAPVEMIALLLVHGSIINHEHYTGQNALTTHLYEAKPSNFPVDNDVVMLLFAAGKSDIEVPDCLNFELSLGHLCRQSITGHLINLEANEPVSSRCSA